MNNFTNFGFMFGLTKLLSLAFIIGLIFLIAWALKELKKDQADMANSLLKLQQAFYVYRCNIYKIFEHEPLIRLQRENIKKLKAMINWDEGVK